jgi:tetratricopeptide (TPR) repeat protein
MGSDDWKEKKFDRWIKLREEYRAAKKEKNYQRIITVSKTILELDAKARFIKILTPQFQKEIADAYLQTGNADFAISFYQKAVAGYRVEQQESPNSWEKEINRLEAKIAKLRAK